MEITLKTKTDAEQLIYHSKLAERDEEWLHSNVKVRINCEQVKTDLLPVAAIDNCHDNEIEDSINGIWLLTAEGDYGFCIRPNGDIYDYVADRAGKTCHFGLD